MAKTSMIEREKNDPDAGEIYSKRRDLKAVIKDKNVNEEERWARRLSLRYLVTLVL